MNDRLFSAQQLRKLIVPLIVEQFLAVTIGMADTVMVASVGEAAVSAVSLVDSVNLLAINLVAALAAGGAIVASQYLGSGDTDNARRSARQLLVVVGGFGLAAGLLCAVLAAPILRGLYGASDPNILKDAILYFRVTALSYPFIALYSAGTSIFRAQGNSRVSMQASLLFNMVNIGGNAWLIYGLKMGVLGAAIPTLVSRVVGAVLILLLLRNPALKISLRDWKDFRLRPEMIRRILAVGVPSGLENSMFHIGKIIVQSLVSSLGTVAIASLAVSNTLANLALIPAQGIGLAMMTVVGQCVGAKRADQAKHYTLLLTGLAWGVQAILCMGLFFVADGLIVPFHLSAETADTTYRLIREYFLVSALGWVLSFTLPNALRAAGDVRFTMTASVLSMWIFRVGASYLMVLWFQMGVYGVWYGMFIDWAVRILCFVWRFASGKWKNRAVI